MSQEFDGVTHAFAELLSKLQSANDNDKQAAITFAIDSLLMALGSLEHRLDALEQSNGISRVMPRLPREVVISGLKKQAAIVALVDAAILPPGTYQSNDPDFIDLDLALEKQERTLMELVYGYLTAEAERDVSLAVKAEPATQPCKSKLAGSVRFPLTFSLRFLFHLSDLFGMRTGHRRIQTTMVGLSNPAHAVCCER